LWRIHIPLQTKTNLQLTYLNRLQHILPLNGIKIFLSCQPIGLSILWGVVFIYSASS
jgi:hypothetical protein